MNVIAFVILGFCVYNLIMLFKNKDEPFDIVFWGIIWSIPIFFIIFPNLLTRISFYLKIGRPVDIIIYVSIPFLFYLNYVIGKKLMDLDNKLTDVVRNLAIENAEWKRRKRKY